MIVNTCNMAFHVETSELRQELSAALKADETRRRTDEMKKRAIHTAAGFDEFRHMVSCAQLTSVTRKELEMLSDHKRGWHGRPGGLLSSTKRASAIGKSRSSARQARGCNKVAGASTDGNKRPNAPIAASTHHSQFHRDWRRGCKTDEDRRAYLRLVGPESLQMLFRVEMEPDILAQIISLICKGFPSSVSCHDPSPNTSSNSGWPVPQVDDMAGKCSLCPEIEDANAQKSHTCVGAAAECMTWLSALSKTGRFAVNISFLESQEKRAVANLFCCLSAVVDKCGGGTVATLSSLREAYGL